MDRRRRDLVAQWAFDTQAILGRFHLWLEDVEERWVSGEPSLDHSYVGEELKKSFIMAAAVTALGTRLFGRYGEGRGREKSDVNRIKKDADAASAYALSEALWFLTRKLPENHALLVSMGEGLMPKAGETPEQGSNPLLGFGRVYARPQVALALDRLVRNLINENDYGWDQFWDDVRASGITVWGAAIDTLENTSRFAQGASTGPLTVLHLFDQPLVVSQPYEGYMGSLVLPQKVHETAADQSVLLTYRSPRKLVFEAIKSTYPDIKPEHVHVWTLRGASREKRLGSLWKEWKDLGVHLVEDDWRLPSGGEAFTSAGTYAPTFCVGPYKDNNDETHLFICDGYAASAEAIQAASLDPVLDLTTSMSVFTSKFQVTWERERELMRLDPEADEFASRLAEVLGVDVDEATTETYRGELRSARDAGMPIRKPNPTIDDFFPRKDWNVLAVSGYMLPDPYSGADGVEVVSPGVYRVMTSAATRKGIVEVTLTLRLLETLEQSRLVFSPLLDRFYAGEDYKSRPVRISDSGRIRNELQTLCSEALDYIDDDGICVVFDNIDEAVLSTDKQELIKHVITWYKDSHPIWFRWLHLC